MEHFQEVRVTVIREVILDYLKNMRDQRLLHEDQLRAKAEELRASSLTPGVSQYPASDIAEISNRFKEGLVQFLRTVYLKIETESGSKIREGIETGLANANVIEAEFLEELRRLQTQSPVESGLSEARVAQYQASLVEQSETVSDLSTENVDLEGQINNLHEELKLKNSELVNLEAAVERLESQNMQLGGSMMQMRLEQEEMQEALGDRDTHIDDTKNDIARFKGTIDRQQEEIKGLRNQLADYSTRERELISNQYQEQNEAFRSLQGELEKSREEQFSVRNEMVSKNEDIRKLNLEISQVKVRLESTDADFEIANTELSQIKESYKAASSEKDALETKALNFEQETSKLANELTEMKAEKSSVESRFTELEKTYSQIESEKTSLEAQNLIYNEKLHSLESESTVSEEVFQTEISKIQSQWDGERERIMTNSANQKTEYESKLTTLKETLSEKESEFNRVFNEHSALMKDKDETSTVYNEMKEKYDELVTEKALLEEEHKSQLTTYETMTNEKSATETELNALKEELAGYAGKITMNVEAKEELEQKMVAYQNELVYLEEISTYLQNYLVNDEKYMIIFLLHGLSSELKETDLARMLTMHPAVVRKSVAELQLHGFVTTETLEDSTLVRLNEHMTPPESLIRSSEATSD